VRNLGGHRPPGSTIVGKCATQLKEDIARDPDIEFHDPSCLRRTVANHRAHLGWSGGESVRRLECNRIGGSRIRINSRWDVNRDPELSRLCPEPIADLQNGAHRATCQTGSADAQQTIKHHVRCAKPICKSVRDYFRIVRQSDFDEARQVWIIDPCQMWIASARLRQAQAHTPSTRTRQMTTRNQRICTIVALANQGQNRPAACTTRQTFCTACDRQPGVFQQLARWHTGTP